MNQFEKTVGRLWLHMSCYDEYGRLGYQYGIKIGCEGKPHEKPAMELSTDELIDLRYLVNRALKELGVRD